MSVIQISKYVNLCLTSEFKKYTGCCCWRLPWLLPGLIPWTACGARELEHIAHATTTSKTRDQECQLFSVWWITERSDKYYSCKAVQSASPKQCIMSPFHARTGPESRMYAQEMMPSSLTPFSGQTRPGLHKKHHLSNIWACPLSSINSNKVGHF